MGARSFQKYIELVKITAINIYYLVNYCMCIELSIKYVSN